MAGPAPVPIIPRFFNPLPGPPPTGVGALPPEIRVGQLPGAPTIGDREDIVPSELIVKSTEE